MATNHEEPSTSRSLRHEDNLRDHTLDKSDLDTSTLQSGAEALVALFKQVVSTQVVSKCSRCLIESSYQNDCLT